MQKIIIGEPQKDLARALEEYFSSEGYTVQVESDGIKILDLISDNRFDIILLETALQKLDGVSITEKYRAAGGQSPVVLLSTRQSTEDLQQCVNAGADIYIEKPFELADLAARVRAILRRPRLRNESVIVSGRLELNSFKRTVKTDGREIHLHPMEFQLLEFLMCNPQQVFSSEDLLSLVWKKSDAMSDTVRTHIRALRRKLDAAPQEPSIITTVRGLGYKFERS